jgi:hypothetical protein
MKFFRYRKPSAKTVFGVTKAKNRIKKATGITAVTKPLCMKTNFERRIKRKVGYYSTPAKVIRNKRIPSPLGCLVPMALVALAILISLGVLISWRYVEVLACVK